MSLRALVTLVATLVATLLVAGDAHADRPTSPGRLVDGCRRDPDSSLCREVRRLCATQEVRDDVAAACKELGWFGDTTYRQITNLCPIDPTHAACANAKQMCESQRASELGEDGEKICREMGWGEYAYANLAPPGEGGGPSASDEGGVEGGVAGGVVGGAAPGSSSVPGSASGPGVVSGWAAGMQGVGLRLGLVDDPAPGGHELRYTGHVDAAWLSFARVPLAAGLVADLGATSEGDVVYRADLLFGAGRWWTQHLAGGLLAGVGVSGVGGEVEPFALDLPVRLVGMAHAGDRMSILAWGQAAWYASTSESRRSGSELLGFADSAELGAAVVWGRRGAANAGPGAGLWLGGVYEEASGAHILSIMIGVGAARNPWNQ